MPLFGKKRFDDITYFFASNTQIQFITDSAAMILSRPPYRGKNSSSESLSQYNDIYVKRNGNWICVSASITAVTDAAAPLPVLKEMPPATRFITLLEGSKEDIAGITSAHRTTKAMFEQGDYAKAETLLDGQFMLLAKDGSLLTKQELIDRFRKAPATKPRPYTIENLFIRFVAANLAMVHGAVIYQLPGGGISGIQFNDIYVKRGNRWQCVSANNTPISN
jgi:hypothetical protein